ncbi:DoxX family protein [Streptomyces sp. NPDC004629]|uniref:DoxX family protein n=1 Tax=Streptomyces sp. NPDC004629 TaxID=3364705 RepID=UPI0036B7E594
MTAGKYDAVAVPLLSSARSVGGFAGRAALGTVFLMGGSLVFRHPEGPTHAAGNFLGKLKKRVAPLNRFEDRDLVRLNAAVQCAAGASLIAGRIPRVAAAVLVGSLIPTTLAGFPFWEAEPGPERIRMNADFTKNAALAGGLIRVITHP